jgi:hypothetical protein
MLDVSFFIGVDCNTDQYLALAKVRERLTVSKLAAKRNRYGETQSQEDK